MITSRYIITLTYSKVTTFYENKNRVWITLKLNPYDIALYSVIENIWNMLKASWISQVVTVICSSIQSSHNYLTWKYVFWFSSHMGLNNTSQGQNLTVLPIERNIFCQKKHETATNL